MDILEFVFGHFALCILDILDIFFHTHLVGYSLILKCIFEILDATFFFYVSKIGSSINDCQYEAIELNLHVMAIDFKCFFCH
jgi:hypothetical protein